MSTSPSKNPTPNSSEEMTPREKIQLLQAKEIYIQIPGVTLTDRELRELPERDQLTYLEETVPNLREELNERTEEILFEDDDYWKAYDRVKEVAISKWAEEREEVYEL